MIKKEELENIIKDLLEECFNELYKDEYLEEEKASLIYRNVKLFTLKLKDKVKELEV